MPNHYFQFKQFKIEQEHCAMKVCTDACLFGSWVVKLLKQSVTKYPIRILDIGTGTGLLSLMTAQVIDCNIDAVEIDPAAAKQAGENFTNVDFGSKIKLFESDIKTFTNAGQYDCIMSNPPFFENDLISADQKRNLALHSAALNLKELVAISEHQLTEEGIVVLLLPFHRKDAMIELAEGKGMHLIANADIRQTPKHPFFRTFLAFSKNANTLQSEEIIIQDHRVYTERFKSLLKEYYLAF